MVNGTERKTTCAMHGSRSEWKKMMNIAMICLNIYVRSFDFILGTTAALWKDIRSTSERHLRYIVGGQK